MTDTSKIYTYYLPLTFVGKNGNRFLSVMDSPQNETIEVGPGDLKMSFSFASGQLKRMYNSKTGVSSFTVSKSSLAQIIPQTVRCLHGVVYCTCFRRFFLFFIFHFPWYCIKPFFPIAAS